MLNELYALHESLKRCGISVPRRHPAVKNLRKSEGLIIGLAGDGRPCTVEYLSREQAIDLWQVAPDNHNSFPAINLETLFQVPAELIASVRRFASLEPGEQVELLRQTFQGGETALSPGGLNRLEQRLREFPRQLVQHMREHTELAAHVELIERLRRGPPIHEFIRQLATVVIGAVEAGLQPALSPARVLFTGKWDSRHSNFKSDRTLVVFDLADYAAFGSRVARLDVGDMLCQALSEFGSEPGPVGACSLTGREAPLLSDKFAQPVLPGLGPTFLFSANPDTPTQHNYGTFGTRAYAISQHTADALNSALLYMTVAHRRGKTWQLEMQEEDQESQQL